MVILRFQRLTPVLCGQKHGTRLQDELICYTLYILPLLSRFLFPPFFLGLFISPCVSTNLVHASFPERSCFYATPTGEQIRHCCHHKQNFAFDLYTQAHTKN